MNKKTLGIYKVLIVTLITSISITGISMLDNKIWNYIMLGAGMLAYSIVGILYSLKFISGSNNGSKAYLVVFIILLLIGVIIYRGILSFQSWVLSWPLAVKIIVQIILGILTIGTIILMILRKMMLMNNN